MNAVLGGILAALAWGSADFIARFTGAAVGHVNALFGMLVASAERAGCPLARLLMIGDTATDVEAAHAAGCRVVVVGEHPSGETDVAALIDGVGDLPRLLGF